MTTVYNFSAGPATLPPPVLAQIQAELLDYHGSGMSVMELSHRSALFGEILQEAEGRLRQLMTIPDHYAVLFLQGGASLQFSMVPLNLAGQQTAYYYDTGIWSAKAIQAAQKVANVHILASSKEQHYHQLPHFQPAPTEGAYLHITTNNTIVGTMYTELPDHGSLPLVADMSSNILSVDYPVSEFGLIYAGAQKNLGAAGVTIVIVDKNLLPEKEGAIPMLDYRLQAQQPSLYNTPPTFGIYVVNLMLAWVQAQGGIPAMTQACQRKAGKLYHYLDHSPLFSAYVRQNRSLTNIPFTTGSQKLDDTFIQEAAAAGFMNLKGHRTVGGMRASLYNAFPEAGVDALLTFMARFEEVNQ
ncbi:MFS transporter [Enterococcus canis]|uniref:Phosphoserine aminotransferase n=1 Tax=Enterococcus canis TaxID=214095 RepID=A0A1L8RE91_9ENTE|nr:3-phosphoserine/phosphohydroxythreonine transaminase [Enterococcus canis]OJG18089.1 MFS transporter [Enterococcus canis]